MPRRKDNAEPKPASRSRPLKSKKTVPWKKPPSGRKRPKPPAEDDAVSRVSRIRSASRGGRGR